MELIADVQGQINVLQNKIDADAAQATQIANKLQSARLKLKADKEKLQGSSGFFTGLQEGLTLGLYDPIGDNIDDQHDQIDHIYTQMAANRRNQHQTILDKAMLPPITQSLSSLVALDASTVALENFHDQAGNGFSKGTARCRAPNI